MNELLLEFFEYDKQQIDEAAQTQAIDEAYSIIEQTDSELFDMICTNEALQILQEASEIKSNKEFGDVVDNVAKGSSKGVFILVKIFAYVCKVMGIFLIGAGTVAGIGGASVMRGGIAGALKFGAAGSVAMPLLAIYGIGSISVNLLKSGIGLIEYLAKKISDKIMADSNSYERRKELLKNMIAATEVYKSKTKSEEYKKKSDETIADLKAKLAQLEKEEKENKKKQNEAV